jgi:hypothetical protein
LEFFTFLPILIECTCTANGIGDEGAKALAEMLKTNKSLEFLSLGSKLL